ncbi:20S proteasome component beta 7 [Schizosaccharomyces japonicus yFS275]|uniref:Proteasome subunit beta n=1 Tax=Schizosaccharomyces japonicus (strain yFS275 / FY16936) TaxID=402676 RepID=B6K738_SCHJY|nr:20S proteasome component beta 7 [Schizosaccharomyces japonicus yFS275]EEB09342.1 20S proteasome component beta 7 [Schizosaccharomyces japonicus yFS275]
MSFLDLTEPWGKNLSNPFFADAQRSAADVELPGAVSHTQSPIVTGSSVLALKFNGGVMIAADNLASYGSLMRFYDEERLTKVGNNTVVGVGGDISDYQHIQHILDKLEIKEQYNNDGHALEPSHVHEYLARLFYYRRSKMDPLWNQAIVAGVDGPNKEPYIAFADLRGTTYTSEAIATGFAAHLGMPLLRKVTEDDKWKSLTKEQARAVIDDCMRVLFYRDAGSLNKFSVATITAEGIEFLTNQKVSSNWAFAEKQYGYGSQNV